MKTLMAIMVMSVATVAFGQATTRPATTQPAGRTAPSPDELLGSLLAPRPADDVIQPLPGDYSRDNTASNAVAPSAPVLKLEKEGLIKENRVGRMEKTPDGRWEFRFEADGRPMQDPPVLVLESQNLMLMETAMKRASGHLRFRITGMLTVYGGRNYILIDKFVVVGSVNPLRKPAGADNTN